MKLSDEEFCKRAYEIRVKSVEVSMKIPKNKEPEYWVSFIIGLEDKTVSRRMRWLDAQQRRNAALTVTLRGTPGPVSLIKSEVRNAVLYLVCGTTNVVLAELGRRNRYVTWKVRKILNRVDKSVSRFQKRKKTQAKVLGIVMKKARKDAGEKLVEAVKLLIKTCPTANRGDVLRAFEKAKRFNIVQTIMEE